MENIKMATGEGPEKKSGSKLEDINIIKEAEAIKKETSEVLIEEENSKITELQDKIGNLTEEFTNPKGNYTEEESEAMMNRIKFLQRELRDIDPDTEIEGEEVKEETVSDSKEDMPTLNPMTPEELSKHEKDIDEMLTDVENSPIDPEDLEAGEPGLESLKKEEIEKLEVKEIPNQTENQSEESFVSDSENVDSKKVSIFGLKTFTKWKMLTGRGLNNFFVSRNENKLEKAAGEVTGLKTSLENIQQRKASSLEKLQKIVDGVSGDDEAIMSRFLDEMNRKKGEFEAQERDMNKLIDNKQVAVDEIKSKIETLTTKSNSIKESYNAKVNQKIEEFKEKHDYKNLVENARTSRESLEKCSGLIKNSEEKLKEIKKYLEISKEIGMSDIDVKFFNDEAYRLKEKLKGLKKAEGKITKNSQKHSKRLLKLNTGIFRINKIKTNLNNKQENG